MENCIFQYLVLVLAFILTIFTTRISILVQFPIYYNIDNFNLFLFMNEFLIPLPPQEDK